VLGIKAFADNSEVALAADLLVLAVNRRFSRM